MKKPFMDHLKELNYRILVSLIFISLIAIVVYIRYSFFVNLLLEPLINAGYDESNIFALTIYEGFQVKLQNTFWIALILTFPLVLLIIVFFSKFAISKFKYYFEIIFHTFILSRNWNIIKHCACWYRISSIF